MGTWTPPPLLNKVCTSGSFRKNIENPLCIGINDIGMINAANVGIGIYG